MQKLPEYIPDYTIERLDTEPFSVRWEELQGWLIVLCKSVIIDNN